MTCRYTSHAAREHTCTCGKVVCGNGGKSSHRRACTEGQWKSWREVYDGKVWASKDDLLDPPRANGEVTDQGESENTATPTDRYPSVTGETEP